MTRGGRLTRSATGIDAPVRIGLAHLGLGSFHRAHQAWYTSEADSTGEWGIHAFSNRSTAIADTLAEQDGLYTLLVRDSDGDAATVVRSIARASHGMDLSTLVDTIADHSTRLVSLTITEAGYCLAADGGLDLSAEDVGADIQTLTGLASTTADSFDRGVRASVLHTTPARVALGLLARQRADAGAISLVPCDNLPGNGDVLRQVVEAIADRVGGGLREWMETSTSFVSTSVDRITPAASAADAAAARSLTGWIDLSPVATEPFTDWVISGEFLAGRPQWEQSGARVVADIEPWEQRKLRLLNGAHSLLAYCGIVRGHTTVAEAVRDAELRALVERFWDEAAGTLPIEGLDLERYRSQLVHRFENTRIEHRLAQIAADGTTKLGSRVAPIALSERRAGRAADASAAVYSAWIYAVRSLDELADARSAQLEDALRLPAREAVRAAIAATSDELADDDDFVQLVYDTPARRIHDPA